ncbi:glycosyltransferase [Nocardia sp. N13]|uniref:glycosyltransferase n=1 Tax=Nocardioides sp. N13(2025) TaxID=3453405 RepID=UPI003F7693D8
MLHAAVDASELPDVDVAWTNKPQHVLALMTDFRRLSRSVDASLAQNFSLGSRQSVRGVFVHDLMFVEHPTWFTMKERAYLGISVPLARRSDIVFTSSAAEAERIDRILGRTRRGDVVSTSLGVDDGLTQVIPIEPQLGLRGRPFVLTVGRLNERKNVAALADALTAHGVCGVDRPLVVVGSPDGMMRAPDSLDRPSVVRAGFLSDAELKWCYENTSLLVFPSLDEGFGLPIVEASRFGTPIAASSIPAFRELLGEERLFDPHSGESMARVVKEQIELAQPTSVSVTPWEEVVERMRDSFTSQIGSATR